MGSSSRRTSSIQAPVALTTARAATSTRLAVDLHLGHGAVAEPDELGAIHHDGARVRSAAQVREREPRVVRLCIA